MTNIKRTPTEAAEVAIAGILRDLEADTGQLVESLELQTVEVTSIDDVRQHYQMGIRIGLKRLPGHDWPA